MTQINLDQMRSLPNLLYCKDNVSLKVNFEILFPQDHLKFSCLEMICFPEVRVFICKFVEFEGEPVKALLESLKNDECFKNNPIPSLKLAVYKSTDEIDNEKIFKNVLCKDYTESLYSPDQLDIKILSGYFTYDMVESVCPKTPTFY